MGYQKMLAHPDLNDISVVVDDGSTIIRSVGCSESVNSDGGFRSTACRKPPVAALSDYGISLGSPRFDEMMERHASEPLHFSALCYFHATVYLRRGRDREVIMLTEQAREKRGQDALYRQKQLDALKTDVDTIVANIVLSGREVWLDGWRRDQKRNAERIEMNASHRRSMEQNDLADWKVETSTETLYTGHDRKTWSVIKASENVATSDYGTDIYIDWEWGVPRLHATGSLNADTPKQARALAAALMAVADAADAGEGKPIE